MGRYDEIESRWLLPVFMRADSFDDAMADVVDVYGEDMFEATRRYSTWNYIDYMDEAAIDAVADELNIIWYDKTASLDVKRGIVKNCKKVQAKLGTKWALEEIMGTFFPGLTIVVEWFEYDGEPNHFRIETEYADSVGEGAAKFLEVINKVKRKSAILDKVIAVISSEATTETVAWSQERRDERVEARRLS